MDFRKELLAHRSKEHTAMLVNYIDNQQERFDALMNVFLSEDQLLSQRAAWVLGDVGRKYPKLVQKHLATLVQNLKKTENHDAIKRNTVRILQEIDIPETLWGETADICFNFLASKNEAIAVKCFSMTVLFNIVKHIPELKEELKILIEDQLPYASAGFKSRGKKTLAQLAKLD